jgi:glycosyltransferase involved in cell wall biosynthesis
VTHLHAVLPGDVDDPAAPSGGNNYDRRLCDTLSARGWSVRRVAVRGDWPQPGSAALDDLAAALSAVRDKGLVLLDGLVACAAPDVVAAHAARLRLTVLVHLPLADETGLSPADAAALDARERRALRHAAAVVATGDDAARRLVARHGLPADRVHVAAPGVDPAPLATGTDGASHLLCVASVTPRKAHDVLVAALAQVADLPWTCDFVGGLDRAPEHVEKVRRLAAGAGVEGRLRMPGPLAGDDLAGAYAAADLAVLASHAETYGMVVTEALARGVPVLATDVGGVGQALGRAPHGELPGILVPPADPAALAAALRRWLTDPALRDRLRTAARARRATLRGWTDTADAVARVLEGLRGDG